MKHCPACAAPNPQTRDICYACRHALDAAPGRAAPHVPPACPNCGSRQVSDEGKAACAQCGRLLGKAAAPAPRPIVAASSVGLPPGFEPDVFAPPGTGGGTPGGVSASADAAGPPPGWNVEPIENGRLRLHRTGGLFGRGGKSKGGAAGLLGAWVFLDALAGLGGPLLMSRAAGQTGGVSLLEIGPSYLIVPRPGGFGGGKPRIYTLGATLALDLYDPAAQGRGRGGGGSLLGPAVSRGTAAQRLVIESVAGVTTLDETVPTLWGLPGDASALDALARFLSAQTGFPLRDRTPSSQRWL